MSTTIQKHLLLHHLFALTWQFLRQQDPLRWYKNKDWEKESDRFCHPHLAYPPYYKNQPFHGIQGGYLNIIAALSYDAISKCLLLPHERMIRKRLIAAIQGQPQRILDLGCGTGSMTIMLKQTFPEANVIGIDLSPYMLAVADKKAQHAGLTIQFLQGNAEATGFPDRSFDLITVALLFHETPSAVTKNILQESHRLLNMGGEVVVLDGNQQSLRQMSWVDRIFEEPYMAEYAKGNINAWLKSAGFEPAHTQSVWWTQQVSHGVKSQ